MGRRKELINPTPESEAKAEAFMAWFAKDADKLRRFVSKGSYGYDEDIFTDAFIRACETLLRRGTDILDYTGYFLQTYRAAVLDALKAGAVFEDCEVPDEIEVYDGRAYEHAVKMLSDEIYDYVEKNYSSEAMSLFEMYIGCFPDLSYRKLAGILGVSVSRVQQQVGAIKKDIFEHFGERNAEILQCNFE